MRGARSNIDIILIATFLCGVLIYGIRNLFDPSLWLDESGQVWMALGQNHISDIGSPVRSLFSGLTQINQFNLDPPGFTILLRFWLEVFGTTPYSLRFLPYTFFLLTFCFSYFYIFKLIPQGKNRSLAIILVSLLLFSPLIRDYSIEIRAYSLSVFLALLLIMGVTKSILNPYSSTYAVTAMFFSLLALIFHYSLIPLLSLTICSFGYLFLKTRRNLYLVLISVQLASIALIWNFFTRYQNSGTAPSYLTSVFFTPSNFDGWDSIIFRNISSPPGAIRFVFFLWVFIRIFRVIKTGGLNESFWKKDRNMAIILVILYTGLQFVFSFLGLLPLANYTRWSLPDYGISVYILIVLGARIKAIRWSMGRTSLLAIPLSLIIGVIGLSGLGNVIVDKYIGKLDRSNKVTLLDPILVHELTRGPIDLIIERSLYPDLRYQLELNHSSAEQKDNWLNSHARVLTTLNPVVVVRLFNKQIENMRSGVLILQMSPEAAKQIFENNEGINYSFSTEYNSRLSPWVIIVGTAKSPANLLN
jgi:hypothetical protein